MDCVPALEPLFLRYRLRRCARVGVSSTWAAGRNEDEKKVRALRNCWVLRIIDIFEQPAEITSEPVCVYDWLPTPSLIYPMLIARVPTSPRASRVDDVPDATVKLQASAYHTHLFITYFHDRSTYILRNHTKLAEETSVRRDNTIQKLEILFRTAAGDKVIAKRCCCRRHQECSGGELGTSLVPPLSSMSSLKSEHVSLALPQRCHS